MKNIIILFSLILIILSCKDIKPKVPQFIISGEIENLNDSTITLSQGESRLIIPIADDGTFADTIYDFTDGYFNLNVGKEYTQIYLKDGFDIFINLDLKNLDKSIKYEGIGAAENNFLAQQMLLLSEVNYWDFCKFSEDTFLYKIDSFVNFKNIMLQDYASLVPEFNSIFLELEKTNNSYLAAYVKEKFEYAHKYYNKLDSFKVSKKFYDYRKNIELESIEHINIHYYTNYVEAYIENKIVSSDSTEYAFDALRTINREIHNNELKKEFIFRSAKIFMPSVKKIDEYWALISYMVTDKPEFKELKKMYRTLKKIQPGSDSPITSFKDVNDKTFNLTQFKTKYVYIDCWAQWCGPCKKEEPFLKDIQNKYVNKDINFVKLSLDKDKDAWRRYIIENNLTTNSFIVDNSFESTFAKAFIINSIPRFILLDKELKIVDANAPRPSEEDLITLLDSLL